MVVEAVLVGTAVVVDAAGGVVGAGSASVVVVISESDVTTVSKVAGVEVATGEFATDEDGPDDVLVAAFVRNESETVGRPAIANPASTPTTAIPTETGHLLRMPGEP